MGDSFFIRHPLFIDAVLQEISDMQMDYVQPNYYKSYRFYYVERKNEISYLIYSALKDNIPTKDTFVLYSNCHDHGKLSIDHQNQYPMNNFTNEHDSLPFLFTLTNRIIHSSIMQRDITFIEEHTFCVSLWACVSREKKKKRQ